MRQTLQLKVSQQITLTPQLQQSIRLLQLSTPELKAEINTVLQENPFLDSDDLYSEHGDTAVNNPGEDDKELPCLSNNWAEPGESFRDGYMAWQEGRSVTRNHMDSDQGTSDWQPSDFTLRQHLTTQLALTQFTPRNRALVSLLIDTLDGDGYLSISLEEIADMVLAGTGKENRAQMLDELGIALRLLQSFDPVGVAARSPAECLRLQLTEKFRSSAIEEADGDRAIVDIAHTIIDSHLDKLAERDWTGMRRQIGCTGPRLSQACALIRQLNPKPCGEYSNIDIHYVEPDAIVRKVRGVWTVSLNQESVPKLRVHDLYASMLRAQGRAASNAELSMQLQEAKWLVRNIRQRFDTILRVTQEIVRCQRAFFEHGEIAMRPLTLREVAEVVQLHESTISRVTSKKYLSCPRGVYELKYFFGSHVTTDAGGMTSSTAIRSLIRQLIQNECASKPLSDARITSLLTEQGFQVARRTVAKYRESIGIASASQRKSFLPPQEEIK